MAHIYRLWISTDTSSGNNMLIDLKKEIKITKSKPYRLNFALLNKHYSLQECGELYEEYHALRCKEDKDFFKHISFNDEVHWFQYLPERKRGQTYRDTDISKLIYIVKKYIFNINYPSLEDEFTIEWKETE